MAKAFKCDRCGAFFEEYKFMNKFPLVAKEWVHCGYSFYHLCEKCHEDLKLFMENAPLVVNKEEATIYADGVPVNRPMTYAGCPLYYGFDGGRWKECWDRPVEEK